MNSNMNMINNFVNNFIGDNSVLSHEAFEYWLEQETQQALAQLITKIESTKNTEEVEVQAMIEPSVDITEIIETRTKIIELEEYIKKLEKDNLDYKMEIQEFKKKEKVEEVADPRGKSTKSTKLIKQLGYIKHQKDFPRELKVEEEKIDHSINIVDYSEKSFAVIGDTKEYKDDFKKLYGRWNPNLKCGKGWIFSKKKLTEVQKLIH